MTYDLPARQRSNDVREDVFSTSLSQAPTLSPTEQTPTFGHQDPSAGDLRKGASLFGRTFRSARTQASDKDEITGPLGLRSLFCAPEPLIDLVFVHGLRGGSIKTWRFGEDEQLFWPRYWLPEEKEFTNTSIHSFGYDSDWGSAKPSILNVHDFGQSLYEELRTSPLLRRNSKNSPIILVGHSMGGLVIKKAYILAHDDQKHPELAHRMRCIFFLATPHRGSDYAAVLNNVLKYCGVTGLTSSREYIQDITAGSASTQLINGDFARCAKDLVVYSFCETLPTIGGSSGLIVEKASAILGLHPENEHIQYLHANHREICKFRTRQDSNYISLRNALATAVEDLVRNATTTNDQSARDQMRDVEDLLRVQYVPEEHHDKLEGSCRWIEDRKDFQTWIGAEQVDKTARTYRPSIFWVQAQAGAGKTVLAAHVISQLAHFRLSHASHFFHFGKKSTQSLASLLQSLALQMAHDNEEIRGKLAEIHATASSFDQDGAHAIWHKIFLGGIFQVAISAPQFWVIDAVDECVKYSELFTLLKSVQSRFPLRILLTSRKLPDMPRLLRALDIYDIAVVDIPANDTTHDINLYIRSRIVDLPIDEDNEREDLAQQILTKSGTSFLWVRLVMDELEGVYGYDSIKQVLQGIPEGMLEYYARAVAEMAEKKREQHVAKAILSWVMLATRPLSVSELSHALQLDLNVHLPSAKSAIEGLCGQLVTVDVHTNLVQPVHATAREFILSQEAGEFQVSRISGHEKIALTCLRLLTGPDMQPHRHRRLLLQKRSKPSTPVLAEYAITQFSEHVVDASTESDQLLMALHKFLTSTILTWIEKIMTKKETYRLFRTARNLKAYLDRRAKYHSPLNRHVGTITAWATDLTRIVQSFSRALARSPDSVYFLIPPLCPTQSAIFSQFGKPADGLTLSGHRRSDWSDCVASIRFEEETAAAVGCGNNLIAVGMESGALQVYNSRSYQKDFTIETAFPVDKICFDMSGSFVAASGRKLLGLWETNGTMRWKSRVRQRYILLESSQDTLVGITPQGRSYHWDIDTAALKHEQTYIYRAPTSDTFAEASGGKAPSAASLSPGFELLALAYRNSPVCIFDCNGGDLIAWAIDENNRAAEQILFNPNPDVGLLLVAYNESHLALYDSWSGQLIESAEAENHVILNSITCSPDGRTFASLDIRGHLRIWDFESLTLLYHVLTPSNSFILLQFTPDGLGLLHVVDHELKVWAPSALVRRTIEEEASFSDQSPVLPVTEGQFEKFQASKIGTLVAHSSWPMLFTGNHNGDVMVYQSSGDYQPSTLYKHGGNMIRCLASSRHNVIASADIHANLQVRYFDPPKSGSLHVEKLLIDTQLSAPVTQLLFDDSGMHLLVSTMDSDYVYSIEEGVCVGTHDSLDYDRTTSKWFIATQQVYRDNFLLLANGTLMAYSVRDFSAAPRVLCGTPNTFAGASIKSVTSLSGTMSVVVESQHAESHIMSSAVLTLPHWTAPASDATITPIPTDLCTQLLGASEKSKRVMFLSRTSWVCSADLMELGAGQYLEHFFVPEEYNSLNDVNSDVCPVQTSDGDFAFCMYDKVVVIRGGLKFQVRRLNT